MIRFISKIVSLLGLVFLLIIGMFFIENNYISNKASFKINDNIKYVVFGHSHSECSFNDSIIPDFKNFSESGESYFYTFQKVKQVINQNPNIEVVFIEFTNNQILLTMDTKIWANKYINKNFPKYAPFMENEDYSLLIKKNMKGFYNSLSLALKKNTTLLLKKELNYSNKIGAYRMLKLNKTDSLLKNNTFNIRKFKSFNFETYSESYTYIYLKKIVTFCKINNIKVHFVRSPLHSKSNILTNEKQFIDIKDKLFPEIIFLDFQKFPLENDKFGNLSHLNIEGSKVFSKWFEKQLAENFTNFNLNVEYNDSINLITQD